jgi:hypothetical protein
MTSLLLRYRETKRDCGWFDFSFSKGKSHLNDIRRRWFHAIPDVDEITHERRLSESNYGCFWMTAIAISFVVIVAIVVVNA